MYSLNQSRRVRTGIVGDAAAWWAVATLIVVLAPPNRTLADGFCGAELDVTNVCPGDTITVSLHYTGNPASYPCPAPNGPTGTKGVGARLYYMDGSGNEVDLVKAHRAVGSGVCDGTEVAEVLTVVVPLDLDLALVSDLRIWAGLACPDPNWDEYPGGVIFQSLLDGAMATPSTPPVAPPEADDKTFTFVASPPPSQCFFFDDGPIQFNIPVTRFAGPVNGGNELLHTAELVLKTMANATATLEVHAWDVDEDEKHTIVFNNHPVTNSSSGGSSSEPIESLLAGRDEEWSVTSFDIPLAWVMFPSLKGDNGSPPTPKVNTVQIKIDEKCGCTAVAWAALKIKIASPVILVHGNASKGEFFNVHGLKPGLDLQYWLTDNSITMATDSIVAHAFSLSVLIPNLVTEYGVDSIHLVAHSKGGLDTRDYLSGYQPKPFKVISFTTLSTPHNGSSAADFAVNRNLAIRSQAVIEYSGYPDYTPTVAFLSGINPGVPELTTRRVAAFNDRNIGKLPDDIVYGAIAADADLNGNAVIDFIFEYIALLDESTGLSYINGFSPEKAAGIVDVMYQLVRTSSGADFDLDWESFFVPPGRTVFRKVVKLTNVPVSTPQLNDSLVSLDSGLGQGSFSLKTSNTATFVGPPLARNHASIADFAMSITVAPWLLQAELNNGDLK